MKTLPDFLRPGLFILAVGINPSPPAVAAGFPFANPRNRFWPALNNSRLVTESLEPGPEATHRLCSEFGIGFTDIVKRPTPGMRDLRAADYAAGAPVLAAKISRSEPDILWFHGMVAARAYLRLQGVGDAPVWGKQPGTVDGRACFVSPNPSPANARFSLADIVASYNLLADWSLALRGAG